MIGCVAVLCWSRAAGALLPTFPLMRMGIDADAMANALQGHIERLSPAPDSEERRPVVRCSS